MTVFGPIHRACAKPASAPALQVISTVGQTTRTYLLIFYVGGG
jgi:hypothetical protein